MPDKPIADKSSSIEVQIYDWFTHRILARLQSEDEPLAASEVAEFRKFLEAQGVNAQSRKNDRLKSIAKALDPLKDEEEDAEGRIFQNREISIDFIKSTPTQGN